MATDRLLIRPEAAHTLARMTDWCYEHSLQWSEIAQARRVNKGRGAWRRPQITGAVATLNRQLLAQFDFTEHAVALLLAGEAPPELEQATTSEPMFDALDHHGLDRSLAERDLDPAVLGAVLILLAAFRARQLALAGAAVEAVFQASRTALLKRLKYPNAPKLPETTGLESQVVRTYEDDAQRLYAGLLDGTPRSRGVRAVLAEETQVGAAVLALRTLFDAEQFRLTLFSEALAWDSWIAGFRAAAVEATSAARAAGSAEPAFRWTGPDDAKTCDPCRALFSAPVTAYSLADLPAPHTICEYRRSCRHWWSPA